MRRRFLGVVAAGLAAFSSPAQEFSIQSLRPERMVIEHPECFAGAYLLIDRTASLTTGAWETVDYVQVPEGASPAAAARSGAGPSSLYTETDVPMEGSQGYYRTEALSFQDSDGDGVDNVTEFSRGTNPNVPDASPVPLPPDDGDPQPVPGSVDSAPGDWNGPPSTGYRASAGYAGAVNSLIFALSGTNGTFTAGATAAELGGWIESQCGTWAAPDAGDVHPITTNGNFYRTETNGFEWAGRENIYPIAFHPYTGGAAVEFVNHLVQAASNDPAGLAVLPGGQPVLVNGANPWTEEKLAACLKVLITVPCRVQRVFGSGESAVHDAADATHMAQAWFQRYTQTPYAAGSVERPHNYTWLNFIYRYGAWDFSAVSGSTRNERFVFSTHLAAQGFGPSIHRGYVGVRPPYDWRINGGWEKHTMRTAMPPEAAVNQIGKTFTASDGDSAWLMAGSSNYCETAETASLYDFPPDTTPGLATHWMGFFCFAAKVLSTLSPPPMAGGATLAMDFDRDGAITTNDLDRTDESHPFRFWVNEDGNAATYPEANLEDFFPARIVAPSGLGSNLTFRLSASVNLDYIPTAMTTNDTDAYLTDLTVAQSLAGAILPLAAGAQTPQPFTNGAVVLLAASAANTNAKIYVHLLENGSQIAVATNWFSFSAVTNMYRTKNLRANGVSSLGEPPNRPDELTSGKDFVFVHGYNVTEAEGRAWNSAIFKRLWHAGSHARFHAILWDGTPDSLGDKKHYHHSVINAFATAPALATYLNSLSQPVVMAHSLGNMVAGSAICDHGAVVSQYYALDAAVALEAYGDTAPDTNMVPDSVFAVHDAGRFIPGGRKYRWNDYPVETWASEWYRLFTNNVNDIRGKLTWRHRFADIQNRTDVFNFYSSTEDILRVDDDITLLDLVNIDVDLWMHFLPVGFSHTVQYAWQIQEQYKGLDQLPWINAPGGGVSQYAGWGFVTGDSQHIEPRWFGILGHAPVRPHTVAEALSEDNPGRDAYRESLETDPLFRQEPEELFGPGAAAFAAGTIGTHGGNLEYHTGDHGLDISAVPIRDWLLAKAFPSRTRPMGSTAVRDVGGGWRDVNFDMSALYMTDPAAWRHKENNVAKWWHGDIKDMPYVHLHRFYKKIVTKEP